MATRALARTTATVGDRPRDAGTVALYARVSTEDQAERDTIKAQLDFLRGYVGLHGLPVGGEYVDDGISGTVPLAERPDGRRLLTDAEAGRFGTVLFYKLSRLGRKLSVVVDAHDALAGFGVAIKSGTEPLDTDSPAGMLMFQMLASFAEFDRAVIAENTTRGRNRVAGDGRYTGGPIPLGYDVDDGGRFRPSSRPMGGLGITEAEYVADLFRRIAAAEATISGEASRLTALGVPTRKRYRGKEGERADGWSHSTLAAILHNEMYRGTAVVRSRYGPVPRPAPALVDPETWDRAQGALLRARALSSKSAKRHYALRGLVTCAGCGGAYVGAPKPSGGRTIRYYKCGSGRGPRSAGRPLGPCDGKLVQADWLEEAVWNECRAFILDPGPALDEARRKLRERMAKAAGGADQRRSLLDALAGKETERERVLGMYRRGKISADEAEAELDAIAAEAAKLRELVESLRAQAALVEIEEAELTSGVALLARLRDELAVIEATDDRARKREVIERYVRRITVETNRLGPRKKGALVHVFLRLRPEPCIATDATS
ncbi:MAG: recombinase family protein [Chloroflexota bacterium]|nr:recombinase family protein [Chloroflexota bacterium]